MTRLWLTIDSPLGIVLFAAVAFASLRQGTARWDSVVFTRVSCLLFASVLLAVHRERVGLDKPGMNPSGAPLDPNRDPERAREQAAQRGEDELG